MKQLLSVIFVLAALNGWSQNTPVEEKSVPVPHEPHEEVFRYIEEDAEFPGGMAALKKYIADNLVYPVEALDQGLQGKCFLQFIVSEKGKISNIKVVRGVPDCPQCDAEAIRLVSSMPDWKPAQNNGKPVHQLFNLPITFSPPND